MSLLALRHSVRYGLVRGLLLGNSVRRFASNVDKQILKSSAALEEQVFVENWAKAIAPNHERIKNLGLNLVNPNLFGILWYGATELPPLTPVLPELDSTYDDFHFDEDSGIWGYEDEDDSAPEMAITQIANTPDTAETTPLPPEK